MSQKFASMDELFEALSHSAFRSKFRLSYADRTYAETRNDELLKKHARQILHDRIGSAHPKNDGKQTPYKGHPIFTAQHATGCCCRGCLYKWHGIDKGRELTEEELNNLSDVILEWIHRDLQNQLRGKEYAKAKLWIFSTKIKLLFVKVFKTFQKGFLRNFRTQSN